MVNVNILKSGEIGSYQVREIVPNIIHIVRHCGKYQPNVNYHIGDIVTSTNDGKLLQKVRNGIDSHENSATDFNLTVWKKIYTVKFHNLIANSRPYVGGGWRTFLKSSKATVSLGKTLLRFFQFITRILFNGVLSLSVSFIVAFVTMVFTWWVLGAIVNPERILTFASAVLVFVGSVKQMMKDIKNMKEEAEKKIKEAVSGLLEELVAKTSMLADSLTDNMKLPKLPSIFSSLNMSAIEIYSMVNEKDGIEKLSQRVIRAAFKSYVEKAKIRSTDTAYQILIIVQELITCLLKQKQKQVKAFGDVATRMVLSLIKNENDQKRINKDSDSDTSSSDDSDSDIEVDMSVLGSKKKRFTPSMVVKTCLESLISMSISTDSIHLRSAIDKFDSAVRSILKNENMQTSIPKYLFTFLKMLAMDSKVIQTAIKNFTGILEELMQDASTFKARIGTSLTPLAKFSLSIFSLQYLNMVCQKILFKDKVEIGEDLFDFEFIEKHEEKLFKFIDITLKRGPNSVEIERIGDEIRKLFIEDSTKKFRVASSEVNKLYKQLITPLSKEIAKSSSSFLHFALSTGSQSKANSHSSKNSKKTMVPHMKGASNEIRVLLLDVWTLCLDVWETIKRDKSNIYLENLSDALYKVLNSYAWDFFPQGNFGLHWPSRKLFTEYFVAEAKATLAKPSKQRAKILLHIFYGAEPHRHNTFCDMLKSFSWYQRLAEQKGIELETLHAATKNFFDGIRQYLVDIYEGKNPSLDKETNDSDENNELNKKFRKIYAWFTSLIKNGKGTSKTRISQIFDAEVMKDLRKSISMDKILPKEQDNSNFYDLLEELNLIKSDEKKSIVSMKFGFKKIIKECQVLFASFINVCGVPDALEEKILGMIQKKFYKATEGVGESENNLFGEIVFASIRSLLAKDKLMEYTKSTSIDIQSLASNLWKSLYPSLQTIFKSRKNKILRHIQAKYFPQLDVNQIKNALDLLISLSKISTSKSKLDTMKSIILKFIDLKYSTPIRKTQNGISKTQLDNGSQDKEEYSPAELTLAIKRKKEKAKILQYIEKGEKIRQVIQKFRLEKTKTKKMTKEEKYRKMFKEVDTSGDGQVDFNEFKVLVNKILKLNLSPQRMKSLFSESDSDGCGVLDLKEFEGAMGRLESELTTACLAKVGLTEATVYPLILFASVYLLGILAFILMGFSAFSSGAAFTAGVGSILPLVAGKSASLGNWIKNLKVKELVEKVLKEDFQGKGSKKNA